MSTATHRQQAADSIDYGRAAARLLATIDASCDPTAAFPAQIAMALHGVLSQVASDPDVAALLTVAYPSSEPLDSRSALTGTLAGRLRAAAARDPGLRIPPPFVEPHLINGIGSLVARRIDSDGPKHLQDLAPSLLKWVLFYYLDPAETPLISAGIAAQSSRSGH